MATNAEAHSTRVTDTAAIGSQAGGEVGWPVPAGTWVVVVTPTTLGNTTDTGHAVIGRVWRDFPPAGAP